MVGWAIVVPVVWLFTIAVGCFAILPWGIVELRKAGEETHVQVKRRKEEYDAYIIG